MKKGLLALLIIMTIFNNLIADQLISLNDNQTYNYLEYLIARGDLQLNFLGSKPYRAKLVYEQLQKIENKSSQTTDFIEKFRQKYINYQDKFLVIEKNNAVLSANPNFSLDFVRQSGEDTAKYKINEIVSNTAFKAQIDYKDFLTLYSHTGIKISHQKNELKADLANKSMWQYSPDNEVLSEDYTETYLRFYNNDLALTFGKFPVSLGSGYLHSLTLSKQDPYFENIFGEWLMGDFKFSTVTGFLMADSQTRGERGDSLTINGKKEQRDLKRSKYLSSHRLEWQPVNSFSLAVNEAVVSGDRPIEVGYLLPVIPLRWMEHYYGDKDNATLSFDLRYKPINGVVLYSELFVDDETFTKSFTRFYGNKWAALGGLYLVDLLGVDRLNFRFEASRVEPYVYTHKFHINRFMNSDNYLGGKYGPDNESYEFQLDYYPLNDLYLKINYEHANVGEPIWDKIDEPDYNNDVKSFLRGKNEKHRFLSFSANYQINSDLELKAYYSYQNILNLNHEDKDLINHSFTCGFNWTVGKESLATLNKIINIGK